MEEKKETYNISVLLVEDEEIIRIPLSKLLSRWVRVVYTAVNGEDALSVYKDNKIDLIITDLKMPVMDGLALAKCIKKINPKAKIVMTSGYYESEYMEVASAIGVDSYLYKPIERDQLMNVIDKYYTEINSQSE